MPLAQVRPDARRRRDIVVAAALAVVLIAGAAVLWRTSAVAATVTTAADPPVAAPPAATTVPAGFLEAWRVASAATPVPVVAGPAVVTGDGSTVAGRDALTGTVRWSYARDRPLCTVAAGFPGADDGVGRALALYSGTSGYCSELTALRPDTGVRAGARNPDARPGTRLLADSTFVVATGPDYLEVVRSDLVKTLEYGAASTPVQLGQQPRSGCTYGSTALGGGRLGVIERCPGEPTDRLTVMSPDPPDAEKPQEEFSVPLPAAGATLVALSPERAAVALPDPPRLLLLDRSGQQVGLVPLDVPDADLAVDPPGGAAPVDGDGSLLHWWTGSRTLTLDAAELVPRWVVASTLGPGIPYGGAVLVPVPAGLVEIDAANGSAIRTLPVARADPDAPVRLAAAGEVLLEQRGPDVVALRPSP